MRRSFGVIGPAANANANEIRPIMTALQKRILQFIVSLLIILGGVAGLYALKASRPAQEKRVVKTTAPAVQVVKVTVGPHTVKIAGQGTVRPLRNAQLVAQVSGKILYTSPALVNGGAFQAEEELLQIDYRPPRRDWMDPTVDFEGTRGTWSYPGNPKKLDYIGFPNARERASAHGLPRGCCRRPALPHAGADQ